MDHTLRQALLEIEGYLEDELHVEIPTKQFKRDILVDYYYYPQDFMNYTEEEQEEVNYCLKRAGYTSCYDALADFMQKANIALPAKDQLSLDNNYTFLVIECCIPPFLKEIKRLAKLQTMVFICAPYFDINDQQHFKVFLATPTTGNLFLQLKNSRQITVESEDITEQKYWSFFEQAVGEIYQTLCMESTKEPEQDVETSLDQFVMRAEIPDPDEFKAQYRLIQRDPQYFINQLKAEGFYGEPSQSFLYYRFLLEDYSYYAYWELDYQEIAEYLSEMIGQPFLLDEEDELQLDQIAEQLEQQSDFSLLMIDTELDGYALLVCKKTERDALVELANALKLPLELCYAN
ncbi:hypothetical protein A1D29_02120 [Pasteurellaceae bacterium Orientalotternb1]|nr:hypothetical protein A1D29_02120 [Pasteurellaceae bacterium Orientalotternb1]